MIDELLRIYEESRLNRGQPECLFNPTLIFNEGWLLRAVQRLSLPYSSDRIPRISSCVSS